MSLKIVQLVQAGPLRGTRVFLSSSIPDPARWLGAFDPREITDAVVAAARAVLTAGGVIVTGAHPTISPLLLYVAAEFPTDPERRHVIVYQSGLFENVMPEETRRFEELGVGYLRITESAPDDKPMAGQWHRSLQIMREQMFNETSPAAGIYIGGMADITTEFEMLNAHTPHPRAYALAAPGGEAAKLVQYAPEPLQELLANSNVYPTVFRDVINDLEHYVQSGYDPTV